MLTRTLSPVFTNGGTFDFCLYNKLFDWMYADDKDFARCAEIRFIDITTKEDWRVVCGAEIFRKARNTANHQWME